MPLYELGLGLEILGFGELEIDLRQLRFQNLDLSRRGTKLNVPRHQGFAETLFPPALAAVDLRADLSGF